VGTVQLGRTSREWVLHVWQLTGASDTWLRQLEARYREQPVFAMIGGLGDASWRPIHEFSERFEVPCIFPQTEVPVDEGPGFYTVYLSRGLALEAEVLARHLAEQGELGPVTQVHRRDDASASAAAAFRQAWAGELEERVLPAKPGPAFWKALATERPGSTLVLWLRPQDLARAHALVGPGSRVAAIYLSSTLSGERTGLAARADRRVRLVYPQDLPEAREARLRPVKAWLEKKGIASSHEKVHLNAYLAATVIAGVMSHSKDVFSRELLLERVEHRLGNAFEPSIYPHLTLGPGQRFASKGSYVVETDGEQGHRLQPVSGWIVP
jgi:hypothetical protein